MKKCWHCKRPIKKDHIEIMIWEPLTGKEKSIKYIDNICIEDFKKKILEA